MSPRTSPRAAVRLTSPGLLAAACALAVGLAPRAAAAYPTSAIFAPTGEALALGNFTTGVYAGLVASPEVASGGVWSSLQLGVLPSFDIAATPAGKIAFAGAELGVDLFGPDETGRATLFLNAKLQLLQEGKYWPSFALGVFQLSPDARSSPSLGYFSLSKSFSAGETALGQLTFGMMTSFADGARIAPRCFVSGAGVCLFRGSSPFEDGNGAFLAGYLSPWIGRFAFSIDHVGGTSTVSSTNLLLSLRLWEDASGGYGAAGVGGFLSNDRRDSPPGPGAQDGVFVTFVIASSLGDVFSIDTQDWGRDPRKPRSRRGRRDIEDPFEAPPLQQPDRTPVPE